MGDLIHLRIDKKMKKEIEQVLKDELFSNMTEFIKDSIRKNIEGYQAKKSILLTGELEEKHAPKNVLKEVGHRHSYIQ